MFYITISNGLLKDNHRRRMGTAVWEFMWCIDKVTRIDEDGTGWILGGKPIKLKELSSSMGVSEDTISINLSKLEEQGYITKLRTPYGIVLKVLKAKKRFGKNTDSGKTSNLLDSGKTSNLTEETSNVIKTVSVDSNIIDISEDTSQENNYYKEIKEVIELFGLFNKNNYSWFKNKTQREDIKWMVENHTLEKVKKAIYLTAFCFKDNFYPSIGTPHELREKWVKMKKFYGSKEIKDRRFIQDFENYMIGIEKEKNKEKEKIKIESIIAGRKVSIELNKI